MPRREPVRPVAVVRVDESRGVTNRAGRRGLVAGALAVAAIVPAAGCTSPARAPAPPAEAGGKDAAAAGAGSTSAAQPAAASALEAGRHDGPQDELFLVHIGVAYEVDELWVVELVVRQEGPYQRTEIADHGDGVDRRVVCRGSFNAKATGTVFARLRERPLVPEEGGFQGAVRAPREQAGQFGRYRVAIERRDGVRLVPRDEQVARELVPHLRWLLDDAGDVAPRVCDEPVVER